MRHRADAVVIGALLVLDGCSKFANEKRIDLRFTPKENVTANGTRRPLILHLTALLESPRSDLMP